MKKQNKIVISLLLALTILSCNNTNKNVIFLELENASGITNKTEMFFKGKKVGSINNIKVVGTKVIAEANISQEMKIPQKAIFSIVSIDIFETKAINIIFEENSFPYINYNDTVNCIIDDKTKLDTIFQNINEIALKIRDTI